MPFLGAIRSHGETLFRVWAPEARDVQVVVESPSPTTLALDPERDGYFSGASSSIPAGALYKYKVGGQGPWPDPCSRYQPHGVHGPSMIVDVDAYQWRDAGWRGATIKGQVIYELHVGAFTAQGTFDAAAEKLGHLRDLGVTMLELMPIGEFPGRWNWGYDGVQLFAPYHVYGDYEALKRFVDRAHAHGLAVILDVVYNHLGPEGDYLSRYSSRYFSTQHRTDWGAALNFDDQDCNGARDFVIANACGWIADFHLDGFRLDATQSIFDRSSPHIVGEIVQRARQAAAPREIVVIAENEPQRAEHLLPAERGGYGLDAMWNDDFHHAAKAVLSGSRDAYFRDYTGRAQEFLSCIRHGFLYQGQWYEWQRQPRGSLVRGLPAWSCVVFVQNHDQVGNTFAGERVHSICAPSLYRALIALTLLAPQTPLLFMGQEFASRRPFMYFAEHDSRLSALVRAGRRKFLGQFRAYSDPAAQALIADPAAQRTFLDSKLDWSELERAGPALLLHRELLRLRADDPVISQQRRDALEGATLSENALALRWFDEDHGDRLLIVNLEREFAMRPAPEPLLAPRPDAQWRLAWSSEDPRYGGHGAACPVEGHGRGRWRLAGHSAVLLIATPQTAPEAQPEESAR